MLKRPIQLARAITRRDFLKHATAAGSIAAVPTILTSCATIPRVPRPDPGSRITLGFIGTGNRGISLMKSFLKDERVQVVAVCDVNRRSAGYWSNAVGGRAEAVRIANLQYGRERRSGKFAGVDDYIDYRQLLDRTDIDAVVIATPDHWHALHVVGSARAGKDIYSEKPLSLTVREGRIMSDTVRDSGRIFQTGSQQRSDKRFRHACELVRNGYIGELQTVRCGLPGGADDISKQGDRTTPEPVPEGFDYDFWLGPAPEAPYVPARSHVNWRWVFDHSGGQMTDWGGHHPDIAQWGMGTEHTGPVEIRNATAQYSDHPIYNTAVEFSFEAVYKNGVTLLISSEQRQGVTFIGSEGWVRVDRDSIDADPKSLLDVEIGEDEIRLYRSEHHQRNFIDCVYSREETIAPIETGHRSITLAHLGNIAMKLGRDLKWNPKKEKFVRDREADSYLHRPYRGPWMLDGLPPGGRSLTEQPEPAQVT